MNGRANDDKILLSSAGKIDLRVVSQWRESVRPLTFGSAVVALLYYDFALTLPDEVRLAWRKPRLASVLFLLVRYLALVNMALAVVIQTPESPVARLITSDRE